MLELAKQVQENTDEIKELKSAQERIQRDHDTLFTLYKLQQDSLKEFKGEVREDLNGLKTDLSGDIQELGQKQEKAVSDARQEWPNRAHLLVEFILGGTALWSIFHH